MRTLNGAAAVERQAMANYQVAVQTGDRRWAGTNANVFIELHGTLGSSPKVRIDNTEDNFERNKRDNFEISTTDVGWINEVGLSHDRDGIGDGWFVDWVEVVDIAYGIAFRVPFNRWLATDEEDGRTDATKPVVVGPINLEKGVIKSYYIGYRTLRRRNDGFGPMEVSEQFTWQEQRGTSVKTSEALSLKLGAKFDPKFLPGSSFSLELTSTVASETGSSESQTVTGTSSVKGTLAEGQAQTWIALIYQEVLEGIGTGNGVAAPWEARFSGHADITVHKGWLSDEEVAAIVRQTLEEQAATSGSADSIPAAVLSDGMTIQLALDPLVGPITPSSIQAGLDRAKARFGSDRRDHPIRDDPLREYRDPIHR